MAAAAPAQAPATPTQWADSARKAIAAANLSGEIDALVAARALTERALTRFPDDGWLLHYRGYALYSEANLRQGRHQEKDLDKYLEQAEESLEKSLARLPIPESYALLSSVIGQQIGSNPLKGMMLGPKSNSAMDDAVAKGPRNPRVWLLRGVGALYTPKMFGGGEDKAEEYLRQSIRLFEQDKAEPPAPAWGREEAWIWLGQVLEGQKKWDEAKQAYQKALEIEPNNMWVKGTLLPELEQRKAKKK
jgi:tetratricopeptide (TPR) repeat protein